MATIHNAHRASLGAIRDFALDNNMLCPYLGMRGEERWLERPGVDIREKDESVMRGALFKCNFILKFTFLGTGPPSTFRTPSTAPSHHPTSSTSSRRISTGGMRSPVTVGTTRGFKSASTAAAEPVAITSLRLEAGLGLSTIPSRLLLCRPLSISSPLTHVPDSFSINKCERMKCEYVSERDRGSVLDGYFYCARLCSNLTSSLLDGVRL